MDKYRNRFFASGCFDVKGMSHETTETSKERERRRSVIKRGEVGTRLVKGVPGARMMERPFEVRIEMRFLNQYHPTVFCY